MLGKLSKPEQVTLELKTHHIELGFTGGGVHKFYAEDEIYEELILNNPRIIGGIETKMAELSKPGWVPINKDKQLYRPHKDISYLQVLDSTVTKVVTLTKSNGKWKITNEE